MVRLQPQSWGLVVVFVGGLAQAVPAVISAKVQASVSAEAKAFSGHACVPGYNVTKTTPGSVQKLSEINVTYTGQTEAIRREHGRVKVEFEANKGLLRAYTRTAEGKGHFYQAELIKSQNSIEIHQCNT
ncbi:hypothetical protein [Deinococcus hopiensis]|uniref:Uncharacterized protein n=1 Tax=Deinococcus hopiensis KR-140 TaxID=695939 RepID=A0A1W1UYV5_9DEIO|nr:hypothetical protein [Deinococcus hopiensis]SMB86277.1 hypothetical protein SAMN00790413_03748 [Deinococcus hopiensis KR-140]